ncbi:MAG: PDZ domain-containing protein [Deltaproteobacteria bacterium]|nr:PDZ domain-containing protein [Deltaproteobacteria bacterium]
MRSITTKNIFIFINIILITAACYLCVDVFYKLLAGGKGSASAFLSSDNTRTVGDNINESNKPLSHYKQIISRNLFNTKSIAGKKEAKLDLEKLKQTDLKLKLWGTVTGQIGKAYAVIEETGNRKQNLYRVGDAIQNATVKAIRREKVVLDVDGRDEVLSMEKVSESTSSLRHIAKTDRSQPSRAMKISLQRSQIESAMENITELMSQVKVRPHFSDGKPDGIMLSSIKPRSIFRRMGLRSGDIITGVDGRDIESVDDALQFYENLSSSSNLKLQLKRRGREQTIDYTIK